MASHFVLLGKTGWDRSGLEAVRRHRLRLLEPRSLSLWDKIGLLFGCLGTKWPLILSSWDKLGGIVRDWRRSGVTGSGSWRLVVCRSGTKRLLLLSPWDEMASHFVLLGQTGWDLFGIGDGSVLHDSLRLVVCHSGISSAYQVPMDS